VSSQVRSARHRHPTPGAGDLPRRPLRRRPWTGAHHYRRRPAV